MLLVLFILCPLIVYGPYNDFQNLLDFRDGARAAAVARCWMPCGTAKAEYGGPGVRVVCFDDGRKGWFVRRCDGATSFLQAKAEL